MKKSILILTLILILQSNVCATEYYVKSDGNDNLNGLSDANAWRTLWKASISTSNGDKILLKSGHTWTVSKARRGTGENPPGDGCVEGIGLTFCGAGGSCGCGGQTPTQDVTIGAYYMEFGNEVEGVRENRPIIDALAQTDIDVDKQDANYAPINIGGYGDNVNGGFIVKDLDLRGPRLGPTIQFHAGGNNNRISNCVISGRGWSESLVQFSGSNHVVENSFFDQLTYALEGYSKSIELRGGNAHIMRDNIWRGYTTGGALRFSNYGTGALVERNYFYDPGPYGTENWALVIRNADGGIYVVRNNVFDLTGGGDRGIAIWGDTAATTRKIFNNVFISDGTGSGTHGTGSQMLAYNNIFYDLQDGFDNGGTSSITARNNILYSVTNHIDGTFAAEYNTITSNPNFVNPSMSNNKATDAKVQEPSPAIDAGYSSDSDIPSDDFEGTSIPQGSAIDIGAFEYQDTCSLPNILCVDDTTGPTQEYSTIQAAVNAVSGSDDTILIHSGTYTENIEINGVKDGTQSNPIEILPFGTDTVIVQPVTDSEHVFEFRDNWWKIHEGSGSLTIKSSSSQRKPIIYIRHADGTHIGPFSLESRYDGQEGIWLYGDVDGVIIDGVTFTTSGTDSWYKMITGGDTGSSPSSYGARVTVRNCEFQDVTDWGLEASNSDYWLIEKNYFWQTSNTGTYGRMYIQHRGGTNWIIQNNIFEVRPGAQTSGFIYLRDDSGYSGATVSDDKIINNAFINYGSLSNSYGVIFLNPPMTNCLVQNNLFKGSFDISNGVVNSPSESCLGCSGNVVQYNRKEDSDKVTPWIETGITGWTASNNQMGSINIQGSGNKPSPYFKIAQSYEGSSENNPPVDDFDGYARGSPPDMGAFEFTGTLTQNCSEIGGIDCCTGSETCPGIGLGPASDCSGICCSQMCTTPQFSWDILDTEFDDLNGWNEYEDDAADVSISPAGQCRLFDDSDSGYARMDTILPDIPDNYTVEFRAKLDQIVALDPGTGKFMGIFLHNGNILAEAYFAPDGIYIYDNGYVPILDTQQYIDNDWHVWRLLITGESPQSAKLTIYRDNQLIIKDQDFSMETSTKGELGIESRGNSGDTAEMHLDYLSIGTGLNEFFYHPADTNHNGCIVMDELLAFIDRWKVSSQDVSMPELMEAMGLWKSGMGCM